MKESRVRYADVRPYVVADRLEQLTGPQRGEVEPPPVLTGQPRRRYDLDDPHETELLYRTVLREADTVTDLAQYLNANTLARLWPRLVLPTPCQRVWEQRFPELAAS